MLRKTFAVLLCVSITLVAIAKPGIKSIIVFGDSLSDAGNIPIWTETNPVGVGLPYPEQYMYYGGRGSNGPVWIEVAAWAYGYEVIPSQAGGTNFAFAGAETGLDVSDQNTPNFHFQIEMWKQAVLDHAIPPPTPWQLFVVWFGPNDILKYLAESQAPGGSITPEGITQTVENAIANIKEGIVEIHEERGRLFLVPNMPPLHLTPWGLSMEEFMPGVLASMTEQFNTGLEEALTQIEDMYDKVTILRLNVHHEMLDMITDPDAYGIDYPIMPALDIDEGTLSDTPHLHLSWDGFHPTGYAHALLAEEAMNVIPIGSWWGHAMARGPDGLTLLGMGWVNESHWPWVYSYGMDGGQWLWIIEESSSPDGYVALIPNGYKWVFVNYRTGMYYDYEKGAWSTTP